MWVQSLRVGGGLARIAAELTREPGRVSAKVLTIETGAGFGGSVVALAKLTKAMNGAGYESAGAILHHDPESASYLRKAGVLTADLHAYRRTDATNRFLGRLERVGRIAKLPVLGMLLGVEAALSFRDMARVRRLIVQEHPALLGLNNGARADMLKVVSDLGMFRRAIVHGRGLWPQNARPWQGVYPQLIAMSQAIRRSYIEAGWPADRATVVYDPFSISKPADPPQDWRRLAPLPRSVALVGSLEPWKGHAVFVDAAALLALKYPDVSFVLVGGETLVHPGYAASLARRIRERGLDGRVAITGWRQDVAAIMGAVDVVVHASVEPEPFGNVIAEAMSLAKPVVASNAGGPQEMIRDGIDGILATPGSAESLAAAIGQLLDRPELAAKLGVQAQQRAREMFSEERFISDMRQVYESLLTA